MNGWRQRNSQPRVRSALLDLAGKTRRYAGYYHVRVSLNRLGADQLHSCYIPEPCAWRR